MCEFAEEDVASPSSEKVAVFEGHRNVLRLLYQLCPGAAPKSPPAPRKVCDFEGLFASADPSPILEGAPTLFQRVAELREEHQARFRAAAEASKAVASVLPSRRRDRGCCSDLALASSASMNPVIPQLVRALSNRHSLSFSFEEAARVESLCNGMLAAQSSGFWFFSVLLHWLKELGFEAPDPSLFGQLVQEVSGSLVTQPVRLLDWLRSCLRRGGKVFCPTSLRMWGPTSRRIWLLLLLVADMSLTTRCWLGSLRVPGRIPIWMRNYP